MLTTIPVPLTDKPTRPRRWVPVSLRMFLAFLLVAGIAGAWRCVAGYQQLATIREIERLGGEIDTEPVGPKWVQDLVGMERMRAFDTVTSVTLETQATDSMLGRISKFNGLKSLWLRNTQVTDAGLLVLGGLTRLQCLNLAKTKVSAEGLARLDVLPNLKVLAVDDMQATDVGKRHLRELNRLEWLAVENPNLPGADDSYGINLTLLKLIWRTLDKSSTAVEALAWMESTRPTPKLAVAMQIHRE